MKARCHDCGVERDLEPFSMLCLDCLVAMAKRTKREPEQLAYDFKVAQAGDGAAAGAEE